MKINLKELTVSVTEKNIIDAKKSSMCACPIALAVNRKLDPDKIVQLPAIEKASVGLKQADFDLLEKSEEGDALEIRSFKFDLPPQATEFI